MRRIAASFAVATLLLGTLAACGDDSDSSGEGSLKVSGAFGTVPTVKIDAPYSVDETKVQVITKGEGDVVEKDSTAFLNIFIANGYDGRVVDSAWPELKTPEPAETESPSASPSASETPSAPSTEKSGDTDAADGETPAADEQAEGNPTLVTLTKDTVKAINEAVVGHTIGSRVVVSAEADDAFGLGGAELGIGNQDTTVFLIDILGTALDKIDTSAAATPKGWPTVVEKDGQVTGLDFSKAMKTPKPGLQVTRLVTGTGPKAEKGSKVALRYLGQVWGAKKPFDENYTAQTPTIGGSLLTLGTGSVIKGWDQGLDGVTAGSRVLLVIPAELAYGDKGSGKDIKPGDTLTFVVDVLGVV
ncbi:FKBP-type peptidyl-prolyl cis-trans isomerase [Nocardioides sp. Bht2]|uniref:FKBP-type peptidyl-prolyl cis-trans isomerase n=1 Tax=Nocardioides sp. Bht2 TaxID=3392297 RepID=UPI0039B566C7